MRKHLGQGLLACRRLVNMISNTLQAGEPLAAEKAPDRKIGGSPHGGMHDGMGLIVCRQPVGMMVIRPAVELCTPGKAIGVDAIGVPQIFPGKRDSLSPSERDCTPCSKLTSLSGRSYLFWRPFSFLVFLARTDHPPEQAPDRV